MADLINLYEIAQASGHQSIYVAADRCVPVQHRRSSCRKCIEACPVDAIEYEGRKLTLTNSLCIGCGACATVCPTEALIPLDPTEAALQRDAIAALKRNEGIGCIACARVATREGILGEHFAEVPCLSRVNESVLLSLAVEGASEILLVDGGCRNCKYRDCDPVTKSVVENANAMFETQQSDMRIKRVQSFPAAFAEKPEEELGAARRAAFEDAGVSTKGLLGRAAKLFVKQEAGQNKATSMIVEAMGIDLSDPEPLAPHRQEDILDAMFAIGEANGCAFLLPDDEGFEALGGSASEALVSAEGDEPRFGEPTIDCRFFGWIELDALRCNKCGICAVVCKQDALKRAEEIMPDGEKSFLAFTPSACVQCNLCAEACFRKAITVGSEVPLSKLFSFDPVLLRA